MTTLHYLAFTLTLTVTVTCGQSSEPAKVCSVCDCTDGTINCANKQLQANFEVTAWPSASENFTEAIFNVNRIGHVTPYPTLPLKKLSLRANRIIKIDNGAFQNLTQLEELNLSHNQLTSDNLKPDAFQGLYEPNNYMPMENLESLDLSENELHTLDPDLFEHLPNLKILILHDNPMKVIDHPTIIAISSIANLEILDLTSTGIRTLPSGFLHTVKQLNQLILAKNFFTEVPVDVLAEAHNLAILSLSDNPIKVLSSERAFPELPTLKQLHISNMPNLTRIETGSLSQLKNLEYFECKENAKLEYISPQAFTGNETQATWPPIATLFLKDNNLRYLDFDLLGGRWSELKHLDIQGNPWMCECENQWMVSVLIPILKEKHQPFTSLHCGGPEPLKGRQLLTLYQRNYTMRCLDYYGNHPERDATILVSIFVVIILLMAIIGLMLWRRNGLPYCRQGGPVNYSRAFYRPAEADEPDKF